jgi:vaccinia related kinase
VISWKLERFSRLTTREKLCSLNAVLLVLLKQDLPVIISLQIMKPATGVDLEEPQKSKNIWDGEIVLDSTKKKWKLGKLLGAGGFGEVYLASRNISEPVGSDTQYIVKLEPFDNGSLSTEINYYRRFAKSEMIEEWKNGRMLNHLGLSKYIGSGSRVYKNKKYRFLVLDRHGQDLDELFFECESFPVKTVCYLGIQILDALEYIHSHGYVHADIKGPNLLLGNHKCSKNCVYLLDFGLARSYVNANGVHKKHVYDKSKAHTGTLEYVSRDAHTGAFSRRGDLESLGYNMLEWLCGELPWQEIDDPESNHDQKKSFMSNIPLLMRQCFHNSEPPAMLTEYLKYVASLNFESKPNYAYCRNLLKQGVQDSGCVDDGKLVFDESPLPITTENQNRGNKRRATDDPGSAAELQPKKAKQEPAVLVQRLPNEVLQKFTASSRKVLKPKQRWQHRADASLSSSSIPTPTILKIMLNPLPVIVAHALPELVPKYEVWCT